MSVLSADGVFMCDFQQRDRTPGCNKYHTRRIPGFLGNFLGLKRIDIDFQDMIIVALLPTSDNPESVRSRGRG